MFYKKGVLRNPEKFTGKHPCQSLLFKKVAGLSPATLLKKRLWHRCFPVNFAKFLRTPFLTEHLLATASDFLQTASGSLYYITQKMHIPEYFSKTYLKEFVIFLKCRETFEQLLQPLTFLEILLFLKYLLVIF